MTSSRFSLKVCLLRAADIHDLIIFNVHADIVVLNFFKMFRCFKYLLMYETMKQLLHFATRLAQVDLFEDRAPLNA